MPILPGVQTFIARMPPKPAFLLKMPNGEIIKHGAAEPAFSATIRNDRAAKALGSLDQGVIAESYLAGDIDIEGDMLEVFKLREALRDNHPLLRAWRFIQPTLFGQVRTNKSAITSHYDIDPRFFLSFLDPTIPAYSQGIYERDDETLATALVRKFDYALDRLKIGEGKHVLEIGPGWGAFASHALQAGARFTGITNSEVSQKYLTNKLANFGDRFRIVLTDFLDYEPKETYDAIVIMGVIEHLPQYQTVLEKFFRLLKPGGNVFLDGSAAREKYAFQSFLSRHIYPGNHSFLAVDDLITKLLQKTKFDLVELFNDRWSYFLTFKQWAMNLEASKDFIVREFGDFQFRRFRLYLWAVGADFLNRGLDCYRMIFHKPAMKSGR